MRALRHLSAAAVGLLGVVGLAGPVVACSGPFVTADVALGSAELVALVRVDGEAGPEADRRYLLVVEESFKGRAPAAMTVRDLTYHACGDTIAAPVGARLVVAFSVDAFVGAPPMNPYWSVGPDGRLSPDGVDDAGLGLGTVDDLRQAMLDRHGALGSVEEDGASNPVPSPSSGFPAALVVGVATVLAAVLVMAAAVTMARRRRTGTS